MKYFVPFSKQKQKLNKKLITQKIQFNETNKHKKNTRNITNINEFFNTTKYISLLISLIKLIFHIIFVIPSIYHPLIINLCIFSFLITSFFQLIITHNDIKHLENIKNKQKKKCTSSFMEISFNSFHMSVIKHNTKKLRT